MRVFVDEDTGSGLGKALRAVGVDGDYVGRGRSFGTGVKDEIWIPYAGINRMLVLSRNTGILQSESQRGLLIAGQVGIVFLPAHLSSIDLLRLVMKKWDWIVAIDETEDRPFAFRLTQYGRATRLLL